MSWLTFYLPFNNTCYIYSPSSLMSSTSTLNQNILHIYFPSTAFTNTCYFYPPFITLSSNSTLNQPVLIYFPSTHILSIFHQYLLLLPSIHHSVVQFYSQSTRFNILSIDTYFIYLPPIPVTSTLHSSLCRPILLSINPF